MTDERDDEETGASASEPDDTADAGADTGDAGPEEAEPPTDGFQDGDFVRIAYTARTVDDGQLVDTTDPDVAEEEGVADQGEFEPRVIVLGAGHIFDAVEEDIEGKSPGNTGTVVVSAEEAFGEFDPEQVRTVSADKIPEDDRHPGAQVTVDGQQGYVETIIGGRARVDFNHPLAGEDVEYEYELVEAVEDREERARGLLGMILDTEPDLWFATDEVEEEQLVEPDEEAETADAGEGAPAGGEGEAEGEGDEEPPDPEYETVTVEKETLYIEAPPHLSFDQQWLFQKRQIAQQLMDRLAVDRVVIQETIDGSGMGMGMGGMMGGMGGPGAGAEDVEEAMEDADVDADEIIEELEADLDVEE